ncbi:hypothetical protein GCM10027062_22140 [Nocardioides hungaricus]
MWGAALAAMALGLTSVPAGAVAAAGVPECTNAELVASYRQTGAGMSHEYGRIVLTNESDHACSIRGYGGLSYVGGGDGTQIGAPAVREKSRVRTVEVGAGERVVSPVAATDYSPYPRRRCRPAPVDGFRVYLPDETQSQFVPHPTTGCRNHRIHLLSHRAYRAA